ncbi:MAG: hypothetical protein QOH96_450 [Blastocatellia bacterium]|nr:hypothetical protein [Blastocatellia bacterium]
MKFTALFLALAVFVTPVVSAQRRLRSRVAASTAVSSQTTQISTSTLPIRRVILYSNGVAYFERRGTVTGRAEVALQFKHSQVDDVLKSMVVLDLGKGRVGAVSYNSSAPPSARLNDIPFSIESGEAAGKQGGLAAVLKQLQGAHVAVNTGSRSLTGSVLTVEESKSQIDANKPPVVSHSLVISGENGELTSFDLAEVRSVRLIDEGSKRDITQFADATASARRRDAKTIIVTSDGAGAREMVVSYTVAAPIWKVSYRVVLDSTGQPFFQGWAIVDNVSEEDWKDVSLSLVSGSPVSFVQPLQQPLYRYRPVIPIPEDLKLDPQVYDEGDGTGAGIGEGQGGGFGPGRGGNIGGGDKGAGGGQAVANSPGNFTLNNTSNNSMLIDGAAATASTALSDAISSGNSGVETAATGAEVGDLFEYHIEQPVTVLHDRSALIPILQTRLEGERVSIYNEGVRRDRPMSGMRLKNISQLTLEDGALTVLDGDAYAGEALLQRFKPGEKRFISFAMDLATLVTAKPTPETQAVFLVKSVNGVLQVHYWQTEKKIYVLTNQTDHPRTVYVEHPNREGWKLSDDTVKPNDTNVRFYRFRVELKPRQTAELPIMERRALMDSYALSNLSPGDIKLFIGRRFVDDSIKGALDKILSVKGLIAAEDTKLASIEAETTQINEDQERLRDNIEALKDTAEARQLIARYVAKANEQETRIEQLAHDEKAARAERARLSSELSAAIISLDINRQM